MKLLTLLTFSVWLFPGKAQTPEGTRYIKTIKATQFKNGKKVKHRILHTYYDSTETLLSNENTISSAIDKKSEAVRWEVLEKSDRKYVQAEITADGDTLSQIVYLYDSAGNRTHNFQIRRSDTSVAQRRVYDEHGNNTKLYTRHRYTGVPYLHMEWKYDDGNRKIETKEYDGGENLTKWVQYKYEFHERKTTTSCFEHKAGKGFVIQYKKVKEGNKQTTYNYHSSSGYNYGILLKSVEGGHSVAEYYDDDSLKSLLGYDENNELLYSVYVSWETLPKKP